MVTLFYNNQLDNLMVNQEFKLMDNQVSNHMVNLMVQRVLKLINLVNMEPVKLETIYQV